MNPAPTSVLTPTAPPAARAQVAYEPPRSRPQPRRAPQPPGSVPPRFGFRAELEGLRAVAVLAVVLYHAGVPFLPGGYVGVDVFFVLSGFLITGLMLSELATTGTLSLRRFYARRVRRLLPAAVLVLTATAAAGTLALPATLRATVAGDIMSAGLYVSNWRFAAQATDYLDDSAVPSPVLHYWSLGIEEQFYVLWPLVILLCLVLLRRGRRPGLALRSLLGWAIAGIAAVSLLGGAALTSTNESLAFFGTFTRIWELALGAVVAVIGVRVVTLTFAARAVLGWAGLLMVGWAILRYDDGVAYPGWAALLPVLGTAAVVAGCTARPGQGAGPGPVRLLSTPVMRHFGRISYSWYLWHWPLLILPAVALDHALSWWQAGLAVAVSYLLAVGSYRLVETPLRFAPALQTTRRSLLLGVVLTVAAVLAAVGLARSGDDSADRTGVVDNTEQVAAGVFAAAPDVTVDVERGTVSTPRKLTPSVAEAPTDNFRELYDRGCQADFSSVDVVGCEMGKASAGKTMVVFGDSHAAAWAPALDMVAVDRGWRMIPMTKAGCPAADFPVFNPNLERAYPECTQWQANALARIRSLQPDLVVVANRADYHLASPDGESVRTADSAQGVADGTARMLQQLRALGTRVVFLRDPPKPGFDVPTCVSKHRDDYAACDLPRAKVVERNDPLLAAAHGVEGVQVIDLTETVCPSSAATCPVVQGNILVYRDTNHLTATYARSLAPELSDALPAKL
jgi:peptidoglycan/LPS O-acetylase OafA/YrhL